MGDLMADPLHSHPGTTLNQFPVNTFVLRDNFGSSWTPVGSAGLKRFRRELTAFRLSRGGIGRGFVRGV